MTDLSTDDVRLAADEVLTVLRPLGQRDWSVPAGELEWDCLRTLNHACNALQIYSVNLAMQTTERKARVRDHDPDNEVEVVLNATEASAAVLSRVAEAAPPGARGAHFAGQADAIGFIAMGCDEVLIHGYDVSSGLGVPFAPSPDLCARLIRRLFPWADPGDDPWATLLWCNGRAALPGVERQERWGWWCRPLSEWDGTVNVLW